MVKNICSACLSSLMTTSLLLAFLLLIPMSNHAQYFAMGPETSAPESREYNQLHKVVKGETLYSISRRYNLSVRQLMIMNRLSGVTIFPGQKLIVGKGAANQAAPQTTTANRRESNRIITPYTASSRMRSSVTTEPEPPASAYRRTSGTQSSRVPRNEYYKVKRGETIHSIARQEGILVEQIREWNAISDVYEGQTIIIGKWVENISANSSTNAGPAARYAAVRRDESAYRTNEQPVPMAAARTNYAASVRRPVSNTISSYRQARNNQMNASNSAPQDEFVKAPPPREAFRRFAAERRTSNPEPEFQSQTKEVNRATTSLSIQASRSAFREGSRVLTRSAEPVYTRQAEPVSIPASSRLRMADRQAISRNHRLRYEYNDNSDAFDAPAPTVEKGKFIEIQSNKSQENRFYAAHKSLPIGSTFKLIIPGNGGQIDVKVVHRMPEDREAMIGLSPACVSVLKGAGERERATIMIE